MTYSYSTMTGIQKAAFTFMILATIFNVILSYVSLYYLGTAGQLSYYAPWMYLLPLITPIYSIPMIIRYHRSASQYGEVPVGCGFIVCTFLLISPVAAILMIIDR